MTERGRKLLGVLFGLTAYVSSAYWYTLLPVGRGLIVHAVGTMFFVFSIVRIDSDDFIGGGQ